MSDLVKSKFPGDSAAMLDVERVVAQTVAIQNCMQAVMIENTHYGTIPGTDKPTLYQPGADKLCMLFRLRPLYLIERVEREDFISVVSRCRLIHIPTGEIWGEGYGSANSREDKYVNQTAARSCPKCNKPTIFRSKLNGGKGWFCWDKKGGCGAQFSGGDPQIEGNGNVIVGDRVWNLHNTIVKISNKRSKGAAVLTVTAASDIFTQDLEDLEDVITGLGEAANGEHEPKSNGTKSNGTPPKGKRATPNQIASLHAALGEAGIGPDRRLEWSIAMSGLQFAALAEMPPEVCETLTKQAKAGEMPGVRGS